MHVNQSQLGAF